MSPEVAALETVIKYGMIAAIGAAFVGLVWGLFVG